MLRLIKYSFGSAVLALAGLGVVGGLNLYGYQRLTHEETVADLSFRRIAENAYHADLVTPDGRRMTFELRGDEWQLDVRMIKWRDWLAFLGEEPLYRLDRISGRYVSAEDSRRHVPSVHTISGPGGVDVWAFARRAGDWLPGIDAAYGSSVFLPMSDGAGYRVTMSRTGLVARPLGELSES